MNAPFKDPARRCMPIAEWPAGDRLCWEAAIRSGDVLDEAGPAGHWRPATRRLVAKSYGRWLTFLDHSGHLDTSASPGDRATPVAVSDYVASLTRTCHGQTAAMLVKGLYRALRVMVPERDLTWLRAAARRLRARSTPTRDKTGRIRSSRDLYELGRSLMVEAEENPRIGAVRRATRYRDGLIIRILAARPLRIANFAAITIGGHLVRTGDHYWIRFTEQETKTHRPLEFPLPNDLTLSMDEYLGRHRSCLLAGRENPHLWITKDGVWMRHGAIYTRIKKLTAKAFGVSVNPHLFRDCAATSLAIEDPDHVLVATQLLGHASLETTNRHYNQARMIDASRQFGRTLADLRRIVLDDRRSRDRRGEYP